MSKSKQASKPASLQSARHPAALKYHCCKTAALALPFGPRDGIDCSMQGRHARSPKLGYQHRPNPVGVMCVTTSYCVCACSMCWRIRGFAGAIAHAGSWEGSWCVGRCMSLERVPPRTTNEDRAEDEETSPARVVQLKMEGNGEGSEMRRYSTP